MNKKILLGIIVLFAAGAFFFSSLERIPTGDDTLPPGSIPVGKIKQTENTPIGVMEETDRYIGYSSTSFDEAINTRRVLFFYASWCPTCIPADAAFKANLNKIPQDVTLIRVNYNDPETDAEETALAKKYNITYQHTFVQIDASGAEVTKWNGGAVAELVKNIK